MPHFIQTQIPLSQHTSWQVGGPADFFAQPTSEEEIEMAIQWAVGSRLPISLLGMGTNTLASDRGVRGLVLCLSKWNSYSTRVDSSAGENAQRLVIEARSGMAKSELLKVFLKWKLDPAVFLAGIPGDVGGGIAMNAGVGEMIVPREFCEIVDQIEVWTLTDPIQKAVFSKDSIQWGYRTSKGWRPGLIVRARLSWPHNPKSDVLDRVRAANQIRIKKQPLELPSCGSVFANPSATEKAGQLIEACGLKGYTVGRASVSTKHANFVVNLGGATASDIDAVISKVQHEVKAQKNILLKHEVVYLGDWPE